MKLSNYKTNQELIVENKSLLLKYLLFKITNKSKNNIKSQLTRGNILVDGKVITKHDYMLQPGQKITVKWAQIHDKHHKDVLDIIYEDDDIIVINKPVGLLSIATNDEKINTVYYMVMNYLKQKKSRNYIFVVHRLDRDTSGVLLFAKNERIKFALQDNWNNLVTKRGYTVIVEGKMKKDTDTIKSWLKETKTFLVYSSNRKGDGQEAITHYRRIRESGKYSMLDINIDTGRKNQIRVHMKDINYSIIGDKKYGSRNNPLNRLGLHAHILEFKHPFTKEIMHFKAPVPEEFMKLF